jgi:hypothetical protein
MPATDYLVNKAIDHVFRTDTWAKPAGLWLALFTTVTTKAGGGTEVVGGSYARQPLAPLNANWYSTQGTLSASSSGTSGQTSNGAAFTFPVATVNWGILYGIGLMDAVSAGNMLFYGVLSIDPAVLGYCGYPPFAVYAGEPALVVPAQALILAVA